MAQRVLERRQRTDPATVFDEDPPDRGGNVEEREPRPAKYQQSAQHDKKDEREMNDQYEISERAVNQAIVASKFIVCIQGIAA